MSGGVESRSKIGQSYAPSAHFRRTNRVLSAPAAARVFFLHAQDARVQQQVSVVLQSIPHRIEMRINDQSGKSFVSK